MKNVAQRIFYITKIENHKACIQFQSSRINGDAMNTTNNIEYFLFYIDEGGYSKIPVYFDHELTEHERINYLQTTEKTGENGKTATYLNLYKKCDGLSIKVKPCMHIPKEQVEQLRRIIQRR